MSTITERLLLWLVWATPLYLFVCVVALAAARPAYSHLRDTISQLGESGAPRAGLTSYAVFLPVGIAMGIIASLARSIDVRVALLALCLAIGYVGAGLFRCDAGAPRGGSWRQRIHNACGSFEYLGGAYALYVIAAQQGPLTWAPAVVVVFASALTFLAGPFRVRGLLQRVAELTLFIALALALQRSEL